MTGVHCVGCVLPQRVGPVDDFVRGSCDKMTDVALYKMAALVYKTKVADPAEREEVPVPDWDWQDIRAHYTLHRVDTRIQRIENIRRMGLIAKSLELRLMKTDDETGERELDKANMNDALKVMKQQSDEMLRLHESETKSKNSAVRNV